MAKSLLRNVDAAALGVALDHAEEHGPAPAGLPDPNSDPAGCAYLRYAAPEVIESLARRLPHVNVQFSTTGSGAKRKVVRKVFHKATVLHVLAFLFKEEAGADRFVRTLDTVARKYWKVL